MVFFALHVAARKVEILGVDAQPDGPWMEQIARNVSGESVTCPTDGGRGNR